MPLIPVLLPSGQLHLRDDLAAPPLADGAAQRLRAAFAGGSAHLLLTLGAAEVATALPVDWAFWRDFAVRYLTALRHLPDLAEEGVRSVPQPPAELASLALTVPPMAGAEYADADLLARLWGELDAALPALSQGDPQGWLARQHPSWHAVGRIHLNLAELKKDPDLPFAFMATYTTRLSASARPQHLGLGKAVQEASAGGDTQALLALLAPLQRAAEQSPWLAQLVAQGQLYAPVRWTAEQALALLRELPVLEAAGLVVRMPQSWQRGRPARPQVSVAIGSVPGAGLSAGALLDFAVAVTLDGQPLDAAELQRLLAGVDGLQLLRGQWVEVDKKRLQAMLHHYDAVQARAAEGGLSFAEALRVLAGAESGAEQPAEPGARWSEVHAGPWLGQLLSELRDPQGKLAPADPGPQLTARLRPYQQAGVAWLQLLVRLGLGACLADDMGLGKTLQVLALLRSLQRQGQGGAALAVVPASLIGNWLAEAERFAPELTVRVAHSSASPQQLWQPGAAADLVLTTYGTLARDERLRQFPWRLAVLDEAQAIKNPGARQTRAVKQLHCQARIAMTGTPVENRLGDLWSLMDFLNPQLLGTPAQFAKFCKQMEGSAQGYAPLRKLVQPYLLRRKKTDRSVIADLPDKTELQAFCALSKLQIALYQAAVDLLASELQRNAPGDGLADQPEGAAQGGEQKDQAMQRRGVILSFLMRFKQICNHPSQWLGDGGWQAEHSGKFARLREIAEVVAERQEKLLVFSQFRETIAPLHALLQAVFGRPGLMLHGDTPIRERTKLVARFQDDPEACFFVLSLKAGGTGLNLTAAAHVVHFDRWWNPAVEDQATDRAYRIGQKRNVLVHKFVCSGTVEERIDQLIGDKRILAQEVLQGGGEGALTELSDSDLMRMVRLDLGALQSE